MVWDREGCLHAGGGAPDRGLCGLLRSARARLVLLRSQRPAGQGRRRAPAGLSGDELRARPVFRQSPGLPAASSTPGLRRPTRRAHRMLRARPVDRLAEELEVMRPCRSRARRRPALGAARAAGPVLCASTPTTTHSIRRSWAGAWKSALANARSPHIALDSGELACRHERCFAKTPHDHGARARAGAEGAPR